MGVKGLWQILSTTAEKVDLRETCGSRVAIDLSGWIVENAKVTPGLAKSHLRNLFFRSAALTSLGILPVFVGDAGKAPQIKSATLAQRRAGEDGIERKEVSSQGLERKRLRSLIKECKSLIEALGLPFVESPGEAEGFCVQLNLDAVVTEDSDAFCYGSDIVVWRNFSITGGKCFSVERYDSQKIQKLLGLSRDKMLMLSIMLGCDYFPSGIPGVGKESVMNLFQSWDKEWNALEILNQWIDTNFDSSICSSNSCCQSIKCCIGCNTTSGSCRCIYLKNNPEIIKLENSIKKKCLKVDPIFWNSTYRDIIREFSNFSSKPPSLTFQRSSPDLCTLVSFLVTKLSWEESYSFQKALPVLTRWQISSYANDSIMRLVEIIKKRSVDGIPSLEVRWGFVDSRLADRFKSEDLVTVEPTELLRSFNNELVTDFMDSKSKKRKMSKKEKPNVTLSRYLLKAKDKPVVLTKEIDPCKKNSKTTAIQKPLNDMSQAHKKHIPEQQVDSLFMKKNIESYLPQNELITDKSNRVDSICDQFKDCSLYDSGDDNDLSFIIDDILSKKSEKKPSEDNLLTSTPTISRTITSSQETKSRVCVNASPPNIERGLSSSDDSLEDSFDRMCK